MKFFEDTEGLTEARGFFCSGVHCDVRGKRNGRLDLGIVYSQRPCSAAGVFTTNDVKAAPVLHGQAILAKGSKKFHAIVANSGNANACTGSQGEADAHTMASETARQLDLEPEQVFVCSTGRIGEPLPMSLITAGIHDAAQDLKDEVDGGTNAGTVNSIGLQPLSATPNRSRSGSGSRGSYWTSRATRAATEGAWHEGKRPRSLAHM